MKNPFMPGNGIEPKYLAGRNEQLSQFTALLKNTVSGLPRNLVVFGLRGTGKTVLLRKFNRCGRGKKWLTVEREFNERFCDEADFAEAVVADIISKASDISFKKRAYETGKKATEVFKPKTISAYGITYKPFYKMDRKELLEDYLKKMLVSNWKVFEGSKCKGVVFLYDEFHTVADKKENKSYPLASFLGALSYAQRNGCRYFLVLSGLPPIKNNLKKAKTYTERMFAFSEVGNLPYEKATEAIRETLKRSGYSFSEELIEAIAGETNGYPYFIQFYGYFLIENAGKRKITLQDYKSLKTKLLRELDVSFFEDRFNLASDNEKKVLAAIASGKNDEVSPLEIRKSAKIKHSVLMELLKRLMDKGLVYKVSRGKYSFSLPLFRDFILRRKH